MSIGVGSDDHSLGLPPSVLLTIHDCAGPNAVARAKYRVPLSTTEYLVLPYHSIAQAHPHPPTGTKWHVSTAHLRPQVLRADRKRC